MKKMVALSLLHLRTLAGMLNPLRRAYNRGYADATAAARRNAQHRAKISADLGSAPTVYFGTQTELTETDLRALAEEVRRTAELVAAVTTRQPSRNWENCLLTDCPLTCCPDVRDEAARDC